MDLRGKTHVAYNIGRARWMSRIELDGRSGPCDNMAFCVYTYVRP